MPSSTQVLLKRPPASAAIRESFDVVAQVITQYGTPVAGAQVSASVFSSKGTNVRVSGILRAYTDANGTATLTMRFRSGRSGSYTVRCPLMDLGFARLG